MCGHAVDADVVQELGASCQNPRVLAAAADWLSDSHDGEVTARVKLRLYHHPDGARIAYREAGTGPPLALLHSQGLTHRECEPVVDALAHRHRVVLPGPAAARRLRGPPDAIPTRPSG